jgi:hypothetical protein
VVIGSEGARRATKPFRGLGAAVVRAVADLDVLAVDDTNRIRQLLYDRRRINAADDKATEALMTSTEPYRRRQPDRARPDRPTSGTTDDIPRVTAGRERPPPVRGRVRAENVPDVGRSTGRQRGTIEQLRERDLAQTRTSPTSPETDSDRRARERRERQGRLKADLQALDQQLQDSRRNPAQARQKPAERTTTASTVISGRPTRLPAAPSVEPASSRVTPASDRVVVSPPPAEISTVEISTVEISTTPDRGDRPARPGGRQRSEQDSTAIDRLRQQEQQRAERDKRYEQEELERRRRIEERKAKRVQELKDEEEAAARKDAEQRAARATSARLISDYENERERLLADAATVVGRVRASDWRATADPLKAHVFAVALQLVRAKIEPLITGIVEAVAKHRAMGEELPSDRDVFVVELGGGNDAAAGVATPTFINFPISTAAIEPLEQTMRRRAGEGTLADHDMQALRAEIRSTAATLAPTVIHEFTHMAMYKMYRNDSNPWLPPKEARQLTKLGESPALPGGKSGKFAEVLKLANVDLRFSDLKDEKQEFKDLALRAPLEVKLVCERLSKYSGDTQSSELPSHLMEILYLTSEQYVRQQLPLGHRLLIRVSEQVVTHLRARVDDNWFAAHSLPKPPED